MPYYSELLGVTFDSREARDHYEERERMRRGGGLRSAEELELEKMPAEKIKALSNMFMRQAIEEQDALVRQANGDLFVQAHPEFLDTVENGTLLRHELHSMGVYRNANVSQMNEAYQRLRADGLIKVDESKVAEQKKLDAMKQAEESDTRRHLPGEDELAEMSLEEIRMRSFDPQYRDAR